MLKAQLLSAFALSSLCVGVATAAPTINNVNGTFSDGEEFTVSGANFGGGPNVVLFDDFEGGVAGEVIPLTSPKIGQWTEYGQSSGRPHYHSVANSGSLGQSVRDKRYTDGNKLGQFTLRFPNPATEVFLSFNVRVPKGTTFPGASTTRTFPPVSSWKFAWLMDGSNGYYSGQGADVCLPTHVGHGNFYFAGNDGNLVTGLGNSWWSWEGYNRFAVWLRADPTSPLTNNGDILFQVVNSEKGMHHRHMTDRPAFAPGSSSARWDRLNFPGWWGNGDWTNFDGVYDDIYVATGPNAAARIEIGDAPTYKANKRLTIATPTSWTATTIKATLREGSFDSFSNAYVYVVDANGNVNTNGYPIGNSQSLRPTPPADLRVD